MNYSLRDIRKIIDVDIDKFRTPQEFLNYLKDNSEIINSIINLNSSEIQKIEKPFYKFLNYYRSNLKNKCPYNNIYANFLKLIILFFDKTNDIENIKNFLGYFEEKEKAYYWKIQAILEFRMLTNINDLPEKIEDIIDNLNKSKQFGAREETLIPILETYFIKLFRLNKYSDPLERKAYYEKIEKEKYFQKYLDNENLKQFFENEIFLKIPKKKSSFEYEKIISKLKKDNEKSDCENLRLVNIISKKNKTIEDLNKKITSLKNERDDTLNEKISLSQEIYKTEKKYNIEKFKEIKEFNRDLIAKNKDFSKQLTRLKKQIDKLKFENKRLVEEKDFLLKKIKINDISAKVIDLENNNFNDNDFIAEIKNRVRIAIIGSEKGLIKFNYLKENDRWFDKNNLNCENIKFIRTWRQELNYNINNLSQFDIIIIGENDHFLKKLPSNYSKKINGIYSFLKDSFKDKKILLAKNEQGSSKRPLITKTNLMRNINIGVTNYVNEYLDKLKIKPVNVG